jgi:F-box/WD-40 domain protein MET30
MCLQYHTALTNPSYPVLITGSYDRTVRVWNLDTGETVHVLRGHTRAVRALQFDQMLLFTGAMDGTVRMWNWRAGECLRVLEGHTDGVVSLSYNGYLLASGSADSTIQVWNFRTGSKFTLRGHDDWVNSVVLWDGKSSPGEADPTKIPSFATGPGKRSASPFPVDKDKKQPDIEPGAKLFSASDDGTVKLWDLETQQCIRTFEGHAAQVQSLKVIMVDMSETELAAQHRRQRSLTPPANGFQPASIASPHSPPAAHNVVVSHARALELAPDGFDPHAHRRRERSEVIEPKIYVHSSDGDTHKPHSDDHAQPSARGKEEKRAMLLTASLDGTVKLWDVETGDERATLFG